MGYLNDLKNSNTNWQDFSDCKTYESMQTGLHCQSDTCEDSKYASRQTMGGATLNNFSSMQINELSHKFVPKQVTQK